MKSHSPAFLKLAVVIALAAPFAASAALDKATFDKAQTCSSCCSELQKLEKQALAQPAKAGELLRVYALANPTELENATIRLVGVLSNKLPADQLKPALGGLMKSATNILSSRMQASIAANASDEDRRQTLLEQDLRLAAAVQDLTRHAVASVKANLAMPVQQIAPEADGSYPNGSLLIDPQLYSSLMKGSMEQVVKGAIAGLGTRATRIPEAYLPAVSGIQADKNSYAYSLTETPMTEKIPSAMAAPVEDRPATGK